MTSQSVAAAISALLAPVGATVFDTDVPGDQEPPWVVYTVGLPAVSERSLAHRPHARLGSLTVKAVAGTAEGARILGDQVDGAMEGSRLAATGWTLGPLGLVNVREPYPDFQVTMTNGRHPVIQVLEYRLAAIRSS